MFLEKKCIKNQRTTCFSKETAPFWHRNAETELKNKILCNTTSEEEKQTAKEDLSFFKSMLSDRIATYTTRDQKSIDRANRKITRQQKTCDTEAADQVTQEISASSYYTEHVPESQTPTLSQSQINNISLGTKHQRTVKTGSQLAVWRVEAMQEEKLLVFSKRLNQEINKLSSFIYCFHQNVFCSFL